MKEKTGDRPAKFLSPSCDDAISVLYCKTWKLLYFTVFSAVTALSSAFETELVCSGLFTEVFCFYYCLAFQPEGEMGYLKYCHI